MKKKVIVAIPAYNEGTNTARLVKEVLSQKRTNFVLNKIVVYSDGSTDNTVKELKKIRSQILEVHEENNRLGKIARMNQIYSLKGDYDILVQLDSDINLKGSDCLSQLVSPFGSAKRIGLSCGTHLPLRPRTFVERLSYFGYLTWRSAIKYAGNPPRNMCNGTIRAFSKEYAATIQLPDDLGSAEDAYSFFHAKKFGFKVTVVKNAVVEIRLPNNYADYYKQMSRFLKSKENMKRRFGTDLVDQHDVLRTRHKIRAFISEGSKNPSTAAAYIAMQIATKIFAKFTHNNKSMWNVSLSTKQLN